MAQTGGRMLVTPGSCESSRSGDDSTTTSTKNFSADMATRGRPSSVAGEAALRALRCFAPDSAKSGGCWFAPSRTEARDGGDVRHGVPASMSTQRRCCRRFVTPCLTRVRRAPARSPSSSLRDSRTTLPVFVFRVPTSTRMKSPSAWSDATTATKST